MNKEILEPVLKELLEGNEELKKDVSLIIKELKIIKEQREVQTNQNLSWPDEILNELEKIEELLIKHSNNRGKEKHWVIFSDDFKAQNFKLLFDTVCKWIGILVGGFYLLNALVSYFK